MEDSLQIPQEDLVSSKEAAELSGYTRDYVGQLARSGAIVAEKRGKSWFVSLKSLEDHKEEAEKFVPTPPKRDSEHEKKTEALIMFDGVEYVSSGKGAELTGYTQDYVTQLARTGKVKSQQVGSRWYVGKKELTAHKEEKDGLLAKVQAESVGVRAQNDSTKEDTEEVELMSYFDEEPNHLPIIKKSESPEEISTSDFDMGGESVQNTEKGNSFAPATMEGKGANEPLKSSQFVKTPLALKAPTRKNEAPSIPSLGDEERVQEHSIIDTSLAAFEEVLEEDKKLHPTPASPQTESVKTHHVSGVSAEKKEVLKVPEEIIGSKTPTNEPVRAASTAFAASTRQNAAISEVSAPVVPAVVVFLLSSFLGGLVFYGFVIGVKPVVYARVHNTDAHTEVSNISPKSEQGANASFFFGSLFGSGKAKKYQR